MLAQGAITVDIKHPCDDVIYSEATVYTQTESATVIIAGSHTNIVKIIHNNHTVFDATTAQPHHESPVDCAADVPLPPVTAKSVYQFATEAPLEDIRFILEAAHLNEALSQEGLRNVYGLHIGKNITNPARPWFCFQKT